MTTETKNNETNNQTNEQSTFAPLGKYAAIGVVLVGVIVTSAIMLDKQLNKAETQIASIEDEISKLNQNKDKATATTTPQPEVQTQVVASVTNEKETDNSTVNTTATNSQQPETSVTEATETEEIALNSTESNKDSQPVQVSSYKAQQKTRMTEMFDRINQRESKQLENFKAQQAEQVARLSQQVNVQQKQIDALIKRNEDLFKLRSASMQRSQAQREQMLNRI